MRWIKRTGYLCSRWLINFIVRPQCVGPIPLGADAPQLPSGDVVYVLENRSLSDLIVLDILARQMALPNPLEAITLGPHTEHRRVFFLNRADHGWFRRNTMSSPSARMQRILSHADVAPDAMLVPVSIFWGRAPARHGSMLQWLIAEDWAVTSRLKRLLNMIVSRKQIYAHFGEPLRLGMLATANLDEQRIVRRAARMLRVRFRNQRVATIGPDFSHQRTLVQQILNSRKVREAIDSQSDTVAVHKLERRARKAAAGIASNMSYPTIRVLERVLTWFWNRIYAGIEVHGLHHVQQIAETHTPIYTPSHRSHVDYLLLSHMLHQNGLMIPHIAAGDNMNLPLVGPLLRRAGAFFMRRSFRDDPIYAAVFSEYLYQVYRHGHCVEFFPEGGRTRTGRLLPVRMGLLKMTLEHNARGMPRPLAIVPVYFGYEKLIEGRSYLEEMRGSQKRKESLTDIFNSLKLTRQKFGKVSVNFSRPIRLDGWCEAHRQTPDSEKPATLGREILLRINESAAINPINLVTLVTLSTPRLAIDQRLLVQQIGCFRDLLKADAKHHQHTITDLSPAEIVSYVEDLGMLNREHEPFGDVLSHDPVSAVLMTWYRNNVVHTLALPSLIACLVINRRRPLNRAPLNRMVNTVFPYIASELCIRLDPEATNRWLEHLVRQGLLELHSAGGYIAPGMGSNERFQLHILSLLIMQTLERLYIVVRLIAQPGGRQTREQLQDQSQQVARKMARIHGLNAPEFFDAQLFNCFIDELIENGLVTEGADDNLHYAPVINDVIKAAEGIIDADYRYALLRDEAVDQVGD